MTTIGQDAADRRAGMTLDELRRFVQATSHLDATASVKAGVGFRGQLQHLNATGLERHGVRTVAAAPEGREVQRPFEPVRGGRW